MGILFKKGQKKEAVKQQPLITGQYLKNQLNLVE